VKLSVTSDVSAFTDNMEASNADSGAVTDTHDSRLDCESEVRNAYLVLVDVLIGIQYSMSD
jgi:hypothetical protein